MLAAWLVALVAAPPSYGPGLYRGDVVIPTGTVSVGLTLRGAMADGFVEIPEQGLWRYPLSEMTADGERLRFSLPGLPGAPRFILRWRGERFVGIYSQAGKTYETRLARVPDAERVQRALRGVRPVLNDALKADGSPGLAYGLVLGGYSAHGAIGVHGVESSAAITPQTPFALGALTRTFLAVAAAHRAEQQATDGWTWSTPVADLLPTFRLARPDRGLSVKVEDLIYRAVPFAPHAVARWTIGAQSPPNILAGIARLPMPQTRVPARSCASQASEEWTDVLLGQILAGPPGSTDGRAAVTRDLFLTYELDATFGRPEVHARQHRRIGKKVVPDPQTGPPLPVAGGLFASVRALTGWLQVYLDRAILSETTWQRLDASCAGGWQNTNRRGHSVRLATSHSPGSSGHFILAPDDRAAVVVLANRAQSSLARLAAEHLLDRLLSLPPQVDLATAVAAQPSPRSPLPAIPRRVQKTTPSHPLSRYAGVYRHPGYGRLQIERDDKRLRARLGPLSTALTHWHYETFIPARGASDPRLPIVTWTFITDVQGRVSAIEVPLEPELAPLRFERRAR